MVGMRINTDVKLVLALTATQRDFYSFLNGIKKRQLKKKISLILLIKKDKNKNGNMKDGNKYILLYKISLRSFS